MKVLIEYMTDRGRRGIPMKAGPGISWSGVLDHARIDGAWDLDDVERQIEAATMAA